MKETLEIDFEKMLNEVLTGGSFTEEEQSVIREQRKQLRARGVTREPMLTRMACEFAEVILASRAAKESGGEERKR